MGAATDLKGQKENTDYTMLYGLEVPEIGGNTCFCKHV